MERTEIAIVGGGLVGSLLAICLAERGRRVTLYERRDDPRRAAAVGGRSINLVLTRRGIRALALVGLERGALALTVPVAGRMMHALDGALAYQPYGRDETECNHSIPRGGLNEFLLERAEACGVRLEFGRRLVDVDPDGGVLTLERDGVRGDVDAEVIFGTDGAGSAVRTALERRAGFEVRTEMLGHGYKELEIPAAADGSYRLERHALHIWPRGETMLMALANRDGSFTVTLYMPSDGDDGFAAIDSAAAARRLFETRFPDALPLIPDLERAMLDNPVGELGTVRCARWRAGRVLLLGDASHAIVPFFGQGMNSGFEDCRVLCDLIDRDGGERWPAIFDAFERRRQPNADAIAEMALENFDEMRAHVADERFRLRKAIEHRLELEMPTAYRSRYSMVMYSHIPFRLARQAGEIQRGILDRLAAGVDGPDEVDMSDARRLIDERLTPFLAEHGLSLDY